MKQLCVRLESNLTHRGGQPFSQVGQKVDQKCVRGQNFKQSELGGPKNEAISALLELICIKNFMSGFIKKSSRAIVLVLAGQKWPAGPGLAAPGLDKQLAIITLEMLIFTSFFNK